jgi:guanylate kinase
VKQTQAAGDMNASSKGKIKPLIICGPSGAGKLSYINSSRHCTIITLSILLHSLAIHLVHVVYIKPYVRVAGKTELIRALVEGYPRYFSFSVSHTTRKPRDDEVDGVQYWFCTEEQMKLEIDKGRYFEHVS